MRFPLAEVALCVLLCACGEEAGDEGISYASEEQDPSATMDYTDPEHLVTMQVPAHWRVKDGAASGDGFIRENEFLKITALGGPGDIAGACQTEAEHRMQPHGANPKVEFITIDGQPACRIMPTDGYAVQKSIPASLIVQYPRPLDLPGPAHIRDYPFLVVWVDVPHLTTIEKSLRFTR